MAGWGPCQRREEHPNRPPLRPAIAVFWNSSPVREFMILTDFSRCQGAAIGRVSGRPTLPLRQQGFSMTTSFPVTKTGMRRGLAAAALTGVFALALFAGPVRAEDANPVLAKVNG